eukprot:8472295-Pyramimonas_sp.AAC.1
MLSSPVARACGARATRTSMRSEEARAATSKCRESCESAGKCRLFSVHPGRYSNPVLTHIATTWHPFASAADVGEMRIRFAPSVVLQSCLKRACEEILATCKLLRKGQHAAGDSNASCILVRASYTYSLRACRSPPWSQCKYVSDCEPEFTERRWRGTLWTVRVWVLTISHRRSSSGRRELAEGTPPQEQSCRGGL